ncbi:uncharacterized protein LOC143257641 isoform X2 [Tachypleus tridentatus]|uniref:uncharacterized protein LOC143257641 isoform X2 n=1 Tax=Tachypleus tridentatus TaxID=6853 RepID=UPI003FD65CA5
MHYGVDLLEEIDELFEDDPLTDMSTEQINHRYRFRRQETEDLEEIQLEPVINHASSLNEKGKVKDIRKLKRLSEAESNTSDEDLDAVIDEILKDESINIPIPQETKLLAKKEDISKSSWHQSISKGAEQHPVTQVSPDFERHDIAENRLHTSWGRQTHYMYRRLF